jgi:hypothetical protein
MNKTMNKEQNIENQPRLIIGQNDKIRETYTPLHRSILTSSRWTNGDPAAKLVLVTFLALKERNGFVAASVPGIAKQAGVTVEAARKAIDELKSPDPDSRSKQDEGRTIEEVEGGFRFLHNDAYLERARARPSTDKRERDYVIQCNSEPSHHHTTYEKPLTPTSNHPSNHPSKLALNSWHPAELAEFAALQGDGERETFIIARGFAELAASRGFSEFSLATSYIAKERHISDQVAGRLRLSLVRKGIIEETKPYSRKENKAAIYRWALPTTLPIPKPESDDDDVIGLF